jgi:hypothetical protein
MKNMLTDRVSRLHLRRQYGRTSNRAWDRTASQRKTYRSLSCADCDAACLSIDEVPLSLLSKLAVYIVPEGLPTVTVVGEGRLMSDGRIPLSSRELQAANSGCSASKPVVVGPAEVLTQLP